MKEDGDGDDGIGIWHGSSVYVTSTTAHAHGWRHIFHFD